MSYTFQGSFLKKVGTSIKHPLEKWTKAEMLDWLKKHNNHNKGTKTQLKVTINQLMRDETVSQITFHDFLSTLVAMISISMTTQVTHETVLLFKYHVKIFLNRFHSIQLVLNSEKHKDCSKTSNNNSSINDPKKSSTKISKK